MSSAVYPDLPGLQFPVGRRPIWKSYRDETSSGREFATTFWTYPRYEFTLRYEFLRDKAPYVELQQLVGLFNAVYGSFDSFLFRDPFLPEWQSVTDQGIGIGNGTRKDFPLVRAYGNFVEPIGEAQGTPTIKANGSAASGYTMFENRIVRFTTAPANGVVLTWSGSFYWRCRFVDDYLDTDQFMEQFFESRTVKIRTVKA